MKQFFCCFLSLYVFSLTGTAHVLDQYLQVAQIALAPNNIRIELRLVPGVQIAERVYELIDTNHDGQISKPEEHFYAQRVSRDISLTIGDTDQPLTLIDRQFPSSSEMREGVGTIRLTYETAAMLSATSPAQLYFRNNHQPEISAYLVNALLPTANEIKLGAQERDVLQRGLRLHYAITTDNNPISWRATILLLFCLGVLLWNPLRYFLRRYNAKQISPV